MKWGSEIKTTRLARGVGSKLLIEWQKTRKACIHTVMGQCFWQLQKPKSEGSHPKRGVRLTHKGPLTSLRTLVPSTKTLTRTSKRKTRSSQTSQVRRRPKWEPVHSLKVQSLKNHKPGKVWCHLLDLFWWSKGTESPAMTAMIDQTVEKSASLWSYLEYNLIAKGWMDHYLEDHLDRKLKSNIKNYCNRIRQKKA